MARRRAEQETLKAAQAFEEGFASSESPIPGAVLGCRSTDDDADGSGRAWAQTWSAIKLVVGVMLVIGISLGAAWAARYYVMSTARFGIERVEVEGARRHSSDSVSELAGVKPGQNIFAVDVPTAEKKLLADPWIQSARVIRELPRGLRIEVSEHEARAVVSIGSALFLVTRAGEPFKRLAPSDPYDIPIITGISEANLVRDRPREVERIKLALEVLGHYERLPLSHAFAPQELHVEPEGAVTLLVGRQGVSLKLGKGPWLLKLRMAERVMNRVQRQGKVPGIIFLDNDAHHERVVVRMR
jgi:cell division protein FtsQ